MTQNAPDNTTRSRIIPVSSPEWMFKGAMLHDRKGRLVQPLYDPSNKPKEQWEVVSAAFEIGELAAKAEQLVVEQKRLPKALRGNGNIAEHLFNEGFQDRLTNHFEVKPEVVEQLKQNFAEYVGELEKYHAKDKKITR